MSDTEITLQHLADKLNHIHADVEKNSNEIVELKLQMSYGRGAVKSVAWIGGCIAVIVGMMRIFNGG